MDSIRLKRIAETYLQEMSQLLYFSVKDPLLQGVNITHVQISPDMKLAKVYFTIHEGQSREKEVLKGLNRSKGFLRKELSQRVKLKFTPDLKFFYDETDEMSQRIEAILHKLDEQKANKS